MPRASEPPGARRGASHGAVHFVGRVVATGPSSGRYAWSGAGFVARFSGTKLSLLLSDQGNVHTVIVDQEELPPIWTRQGRASYLVAEGLAPGPHLLEVYRRTEALFGATELLGLSTDGELLPAPGAAPLLVEIVGDSISCGYGNLGADPSCRFGPETEDHFRSYGAILARRLGAESSTVAWSGRGVVKNYAGEPGALLPELYDAALPGSPHASWSAPGGAALVIVNLGTNDFSTEPDPSREEFSLGYVRLLEKVRANHPRAQVLTTVGPMLLPEDLARAEEAILGAVQIRRAAGDARVHYHRMQTVNALPGCDYHPSARTHERMAEELLEVLLRLEPSLGSPAERAHGAK